MALSYDSRCRMGLFGGIGRSLNGRCDELPSNRRLAQGHDGGGSNSSTTSMPAKAEA